MNIPTVKTLSRIKGITPEQAKRLRTVLENRRHDVRRVDVTLSLANEIINGHGNDYIASNHDGMHSVKGIEYVNLGDTYDTTLCFNHRTKTWAVCSWGDLVEQRPSFYA